MINSKILTILLTAQFKEMKTLMHKKFLRTSVVILILGLVAGTAYRANAMKEDQETNAKYNKGVYMIMFENELTKNQGKNLKCDLQYKEGATTTRYYTKKQQTGYSEGKYEIVYHYQDVKVPYNHKDENSYLCTNCGRKYLGNYNKLSTPKINFEDLKDQSFSGCGDTRIMNIDISYPPYPICQKPSIGSYLAEIWKKAALPKNDDWSNALEKMWKAARELDVKVNKKDLSGITYKVNSGGCNIF